MELYAILRRVNWLFVFRRVIDGVGGFISLFIVSVFLLSGMQSHPVLTITMLVMGWIASNGVGGLIGAFSQPEWKNTDISILRRLASKDWIVVPDNGNYSAYGPNGAYLWLDHWRDVEEFAKGVL